MVDGQIIKTCDLPSKGIIYPQDIEIYVKPMTLKEEVASSAGRFEVSKAGYYENLLHSISIKGGFDKRKLLFADIQMIDLVRRLYTFELETPIDISDCKCSHCEAKINASFMLHELEFTEYTEDIFGKEFTFTDGVTVTVTPITIDQFMKISRKYLTNLKPTNGIPDISEYVMAYYAASVTKITSEDKERVFESLESLFNYTFKYLSELYKNKDRKILDKMDKELTSTILPIKMECKQCMETTEVYLDASTRFCQE